jgi:hypothetical protein
MNLPKTSILLSVPSTSFNLSHLHLPHKTQSDIMKPACPNQNLPNLFRHIQTIHYITLVISYLSLKIPLFLPHLRSFPFPTHILLLPLLKLFAQYLIFLRHHTRWISHYINIIVPVIITVFEFDCPYVLTLIPIIKKLHFPLVRYYVTLHFRYKPAYQHIFHFIASSVHYMPVTVAVQSEVWVLAGWLLGSWVRIPLKAWMFVRDFM